jgi:hypothetical protein
MSDSIEFDKLDYSVIIKVAIKKDKKLGSIATKITDMMKKKKIHFENKESYFNLLSNIENIGILKIQNKKISIELTKYDIILNFIIGKEKEISQNLIIFQNLNL